MRILLFLRSDCAVSLQQNEFDSAEETEGVANSLVGDAISDYVFPELWVDYEKAVVPGEDEDSSSVFHGPFEGGVGLSTILPAAEQGDLHSITESPESTNLKVALHSHDHLAIMSSIRA
jgi:hypothetical protein